MMIDTKVAPPWLTSRLRWLSRGMLPDTGRISGVLGAAASRLFFREFVRNPRAVGAIWPSSVRLGQHMTWLIPIAGEGIVVELGAGTGVVTRALLDRGIAPDRLRIVERSPALAERLRKEFPTLQIICADAADLDQILPQGTVIDAIVSSLPLRTLPKAEVLRIVKTWPRLLRPGGLAVQFTYALFGRSHALAINHSLLMIDRRIVWCNLPPARVTVLTKPL